MKRKIFVVLAVGLLAGGLMGCFSLGESVDTKVDSESSGHNTEPSVAPERWTVERQIENINKLIQEDTELLAARKKEKGELLGTVDLDEILKPWVIFRKQGLESVVYDVGTRYWFKIRAIYKGYGKEEEIGTPVYFEDIIENGQSPNTEEALLSMAYGVDTSVYAVHTLGEVFSASGITVFDNITSILKEPNTIVTFYCCSFRLIEKNRRPRLVIWLLFIDDTSITVLFDRSKFLVASGMSYISTSDGDAFTASPESVLMSLSTGGIIGNKSANIFDPLKYKLVDLMDARVAMNKKDIRNNYTLSEVKVKYVSEVVFKGQSNTTITVSTADDVLTEKMNFFGRASTIKNGDRIRVYYTIAKAPIEKWEIQAIECL
ncbi:MAG: hypothetical protein LBG22_02820 [Treponema sp.]|nr:hypothetical protein [Treponema sp.]